MNYLLLLIVFGAAGGLAGLSLYLGNKVLLKVSWLHQPVFIPSQDDKLKTVVSFLTLASSSKLIDLGSGDGKALLTMASQTPAKLYGVEINPFLVRVSQRRVAELNLSYRIHIKQQSLWTVDFGQFDVIYLYGTSYIMEQLEQKALLEMKPGSLFISNHFFFPTLKPEQEVNDVYLYKF